MKEENTLIVKNTLYLYTRLFVILGINLYASRVILDVLGISDYGLYNLVGGIITFFSFISSSMVGATQRFLSYYMGINNYNELNKVFVNSFIIHILLAVIIFLIAEFVGVWLVNIELNIPADRIFAANCVYQFAVFSFVLSVILIPYNAAILAHQEMKIFSYASILDALLRLLVVVLLLNITVGDKLIIYSVLLFIVHVIMPLIFFHYSRKNYDEVKWSRNLFNLNVSKKILSYTSWSFLGTLSFSINGQGLNIILNLFYGTILNASYGIAQQINGMLKSVSDNLLIAVRPQIIQSYSSDDLKRNVKLVYLSSRIQAYLITLISIPFLINIDFILNLWLVEVPQYTSNFLWMIIVSTFLYSMSSPITIAIQATGKIKLFQIGISIINVLELPVAFLLLNMKVLPYYLLLPTIISNIIGICFRFYIIKQSIVNYDWSYYLIRIVLRNMLIFLVCFFLNYSIINTHSPSIIYDIFSVLLSFIVCLLTILLLGFTRNEILYMKVWLLSKIKM